MIDAAERPVIFCGHGIVAAGAGELLRELVEKAGHARWPRRCSASAASRRATR